MIKKLLASSLVLAGAVLLPSANASILPQGVKLEFAMESAHAELTHVNSNIYQLKMPTQDVHTVLAFTTRPHRKAIHLKPQQFWDAVSSANNSFIKNPPNLVVTWSEKYDAASYELTQYHVGPQWITMQLKGIGGYGKASQSIVKSGRVSLYIDDAVQDCHDWLASAGYDG